jgi:hypothetical protein
MGENFMRRTGEGEEQPAAATTSLHARNGAATGGGLDGAQVDGAGGCGLVVWGGFGFGLGWT